MMPVSENGAYNEAITNAALDLLILYSHAYSRDGNMSDYEARFCLEVFERYIREHSMLNPRVSSGEPATISWQKNYREMEKLFSCVRQRFK